MKQILIRPIFFWPFVAIIFLMAFFLLVLQAIDFMKPFYSTASQSEAKAKLVQLFYLQKANFEEHNTYSPCLDNLDLQPSSWDKYSFGFAGPKLSSFNCKKTFYIPSKIENELEDIQEALNQSVVEKNRFTAFAVGRICPAETCPLDVWSIDQNKLLTNVQVGSLKLVPYKLYVAVLLLLGILKLFFVRKKLQKLKNSSAELVFKL